MHFADPAPALQVGLRDRFGTDVGAEAARAALRAEIAFYRANLHRGADPAGLAEVRRDCARVIRDELGPVAAGWALETVEEILLHAIRFEPYPEAAGVLAELRSRGVRTVVLSNWDVSLRGVLERTGLAPLVDGVQVSAEEGVAKPHPLSFARALARARASASDAVHAGDSIAEDVEGARAAGVMPVLIARRGEQPPPGVPALPDLTGLPALLEVLPLGRR